MGNTLQLVHLVCLNSAIRLDGHTPSIKPHVDQFKKSHGPPMEHYVLAHVAVEMSSLQRSLTNSLTIAIGKPILMTKTVL